MDRMLLKMPRIFRGILFFASFVALAAHAQTPSHVLQWNLQTVGESVEEGIDQETLDKSSQIFDTRLRAKIKYWFNENLHFDFQPVVKFQSGRNQSLDGSGSPDNSLFFNQAALRWVPSRQLVFSAGAINQGNLHTSLVSDEIPFPAIRAGGRISFGNSELALLGEVSVPTSNSLETNTNEIESSPSKDAVQIQFNWKPHAHQYIKNKIGYYAYKNLPSDIALASEPLGNTTREEATEHYVFEYGFQGIEIQSEWKIPLSGQFDFIGRIEAAENNLAPENHNKGLVYGAGLLWRLNSRHEIGLMGSQFRVESDVSPAFFANRDSFRNNRVGYEAETSWHLKKEKFKVTMAFKEADVILITGDQTKARLMQLKLETDYGSL
jgi:hypothetical protein